MSLWGDVIELEKKTNRLWINGPGQLVLPVTQDLDGKPLLRPQQLTGRLEEGHELSDQHRDLHGQSRGA